jgi:hypothetical protein
MSVEIALAMVLLKGAGLMMRSFWRMNTYAPGFSPENVLVMKLSLAGGKYGRNWPAQDIYLRQMLAAIESLPGVEAIGIDCGSFNQAVKPSSADKIRSLERSHVSVRPRAPILNAGIDRSDLPCRRPLSARRSWWVLYTKRPIMKPMAPPTKRSDVQCFCALSRDAAITEARPYDVYGTQQC